MYCQEENVTLFLIVLVTDWSFYMLTGLTYEDHRDVESTGI